MNSSVRMLRDFRFLRRNSGKNPNLDEVENVPVNHRDSLGSLTGTEAPSRPPLNTIQEPYQTFKGGIDREVSFRVSKTDRTPTKPKATATLPLRTPEKQGKSRCGWAQRGDSSSGAVEPKDEGRVEVVGDGAQSKTLSNLNTPRSTRTDGRRANSSFSECNSTQSTPTKSVSKPPNPGFFLASGSRNPANGSRISNFAALSKGMPISCNSVTVVNTIEVPHFELKEDSSFWMEHNVQVLIRVRPLSNAEKSTHGYSRCLKQESAQCVTWVGQPESRFTFDHVACETIDQETLFRMVGLPMVENCLSGYNSCMFAYGQTGSGKTHTMLGNVEELENKPSPSRGMTPRIFEFLFARIRAEEESRKDEKLRYHCKCSFLEIYNEQITDLLDPSSTNLLLREDVKKGVYVENLSEFEVHTVVDILKLLRQGASNRKVAATNMNRESSRSHSVFTCVIESSWEKDSTSNFRFARLNLVDLAGSERQKTSGAEGERLKEAANINKSLSTLGHVIMVLVDVANGRPRHIPYRDSRLTFLLQDSLGGNSKTMIIANVSPSMCCAAETLNTLKFAQRAKLIQNNAVVNEDSSGDVVALQNQIRLLKEELSLFKRQNVSRSLSFGPSMAMDVKQVGDKSFSGKELETDQQDHLQGKEKGILRLSTKQLKSLETTLAGALRREQMAETSIKQLEAEIEQLTRLAHQREEDTRCTKMMLKFREDKIQRMESLIGGLIPPDAYLLEENSALCDEIQLLQAKLEKNPEVTRFALENIRLLEQLRRFQDFYEEGEREMLLAEVSGLRDQLTLYLDGNLKQFNHPKADIDHEAVNTFKENDSLQLELKRTVSELEECRSNLDRSLECNTKLRREIEDVRASLNDIRYVVTPHHESNPEVIKESISEAPSLGNRSIAAAHNEKKDLWHESSKKLTEEIVDLQLELDILKIILKEERSCSFEAEEKALSLCRDLELSEGKVLLITEQCQAIKKELEEAKSVIEALESQQILSIKETEDLKHRNSRYAELVLEQEQELSSLKEQTNHQEFRTLSSLKHPEYKDCLLQEKLKKMHISFEKAKRLNEWYQSDQALQSSNEEEMDEVRRQVEAETAEVIVCLQEELTVLQQEVQSCNLKEMETQERLASSLAETRILEEKLLSITQDNKNLSKMFDNKEKEIEKLTEEWDLLTSEIVAVLLDGDESLKDVSNQLNIISSSLPQKRSLITSELHRMRKHIFEKDLMIEELSRCLDDALGKRNDMECMLRSLKGAALVMTEVHQQECIEKDKEIVILSSQLTAQASTILDLKDKIVLQEDGIQEASKCATVAFLVVSRLSELNSNYLDTLMNMNVQLAESAETIRNKDVIIQHQILAIDEGEKQIQSLRKDLEILEESCSDLRTKLSEEQKCSSGLRLELEEIEETNISKAEEKLAELKEGVSAVRSWMQQPIDNSPGPFTNDKDGVETGTKRGRDLNSCIDEDTRPKFQNSFCSIGATDHKTLKDGKNRDTTIALLKKEIECALESLKGVEAEFAKLYTEKEKFLMSGKDCERRSLEALVHQVLVLQGGMDGFEAEFQSKIDSLNSKLQQFEEIVQHSCASRFQEKELLAAELGEAKVAASQKATEASCVLAKFEEVQDTMKEADIMINELLIANETLKVEAKELKRKELSLINERDNLIKKTQSLQSINNLKDLQHAEQENQLESDMMAIRSSMQELECIVSQVQMNSMEDYMSVASDCISMKSQLQNSIKLIKSCLEDIWSEIIVKDCAISILHLCHIGVLLETVTGLNAENGLLYHGISGSDAVISQLREHNSQSRRELDKCRIVEGKLLADIKNSFDRMSKQEDETGELSVKLTAFEQKILDLQHQEELMLQRSNYMSAELTVLMKDLDLNNRNALASVLDQERLLKEKAELLCTKEDNFIVELSAKEFESLVLSSELKQVSSIRADVEKGQIITSEIIATFNENSVLHRIDASISEALLLEKELECSTLKDICEKAEKQHQELLVELDEQNSAIAQMNGLNRVLLLDVQSLKEALALNDGLESSFAELKEANLDLSSQVENLTSESKKFLEENKMMEAALALSSSKSSTLEQQNKMMQENICLLQTASSQLQHDLEIKDRELGQLSCLVEENKAILCDMGKKNSECSGLLQELEDKKDELQSSLRYTNLLGIENQTLRDNISSLKNSISNLQADLEAEKAALNEFQLSVIDDLRSKDQDLQIQVDKLSAVEKENSILRDELTSFLNEKHEYLNTLSLKIVKCTDSVENMFQEMCIINESINNRFLEEYEHMEKLAKELTSETVSLQTELWRKDDILSGLLFDMRLLQESASNMKDQKDEFKSLLASLEALEDELMIKSEDLNEAVLKSQKLEKELQEKISKVSALESDAAKGHETLKSLSSENLQLAASVKEAIETKKSAEEELMERSKVNEDLEKEVAQMGTALAEMNTAYQSLNSNLNDVTDERDDLRETLLVLKKELEREKTISEENEALIAEAQQIAEIRRLQVEDKEEEIKLLEQSIEELECTVNVLENKVELLQGEAERQRLQREELESELHAVMQQMHNVENCDADMKRTFDENEKKLQESLLRAHILESEIAARDVEIARCKSHICELNLHAEAQASEYKQKFKALEAMVEHLKQDSPAVHGTYLSANKLEKNGPKSRGSGSPFKCIGLGIVQQIKSEKEEEICAGRHRIEELEALAASRQKEIFLLNSRLAAAESMTHDVIRDLLGIKLDMNSCVTLLDNQQLQMLTEKAQLHNAEVRDKEQELDKLKQQLNEFIKERKGWLIEIERKQAEMVAAQVMMEKLRQQDQLLTTENEMLRAENISHKERVLELESEIKKLSGQQNIQQRIHHHAKIKEENNSLRSQNDELITKLRKMEALLTRIKEELAHYRAANGRSPCINFDEEQRLCNKLKETETERLQVAQELVSLCTSILKAAGITRPTSEISPALAQEALEELKHKINTLERELQDSKLKNRMNNERIRLSELMPETSPLRSRTDQSSHTRDRLVQTPFLSALDR